MLQSIAASIKDLSHEMKAAVAALRETLQLSMTSTDSSIAQLLTQCTLLALTYSYLLHCNGLCLWTIYNGTVYLWC